jgi:hypothetical protein
MKISVMTRNPTIQKAKERTTKIQLKEIEHIGLSALEYWGLRNKRVSECLLHQ